MRATGFFVCPSTRSTGRFLLLVVGVIGLWSTDTSAADWDTWVGTLRSVDRGGQGNGAAIRAWKELAALDASQLPAVLEAMDGANPLAANWIRSAAETIYDRASRAGEPISVQALKEFLANTEHDPKSRRLAYEWIIALAPDAKEQLVVGFLNDPSRELRRDAVADLLDRADVMFEGDSKSDSANIYRQAFAAARDPDQVKRAQERLEVLGESVDVAAHYGYIVRWHVIGPFDNTDEQGFDEVFPPEDAVELAASYAGKTGTVQWVEAESDDEGKVDLHTVIDKLLGVTAYATAEFRSSERQVVNIRYVSLNATKLWVNGKLIAGNEVYHTGDAFDQYQATVTLAPGANQILLKVCQNEMEQEWAHKWEFKLRVCDSAGTAILSDDRVAEKTEQTNPAGIR